MVPFYFPVKNARNERPLGFLCHLEKLTGQEEKDESIESILSTVRDTNGVILKKTATKRYRITINVDFNDPEKLLTSLKNFINKKKWKPFLKKNTQEENEEAVGQGD
jgi:hypothetical protein